MANISTLTVSFKAETAKFENNLKRSRQKANDWGKAVKAGMSVAAAGIGVATYALTQLTKESLRVVDEQRKMARVLGTSQAVFSGLSLAAEISGSSMGGLNKALRKMQKAISDADRGLKTYTDSFDAMGLSVGKVIRLPVEQQFTTIIRGLKEMDQQTKRVAISQDLFGAKNVDLLNIMELGAEGIESYIDKVKELGVALTDKQTDAIEKANDAITVMKKAFAGLGNQIAARVAPVIINVAEFIARLTSVVTKAIPRFVAWAAAILGVKRELQGLTLADLTYEIQQQDKAVLAAANNLAREKQALIGDTIGGKSFNADNIKELPIIIRLQAAYNEENERYNALLRERLRLKKEGEVAIGGDPILDDTGAGDTSSNVSDDFGSRAMGTMERIREEIDAQTAQWMKWKNEAVAAIEATLTPSERLQEAAFQINRQLEKNPFFTPEIAARLMQQSVDEYLAALQAMKDGTENAMTEIEEFQRAAFENMQGILADYLFDPWDDGLKGMLKSFVEMLRKMVAQILATKILEYLFGLFGNGAGAGASATRGGITTPNAIGIGRADTRMRIVGENGPELFAPGASGSIRPLGSVSVTQENNFGGGNDLNVATLIPILEENNKKVKAEILDAFDRGAFA